jgi:hypothetical protein
MEIFYIAHQTPMQEFGADNTQTDTSHDNLPPSAQKVLSTLHILKSQHASLLSSIQGSNAGSPLLPSTTEEPEHLDNHLSSSWAPTVSKRSRASVATTLSDSTHEWFDALDGAEEFVMEDQAGSGNGQPSYITASESQISLTQKCDEADTDSEDEDYTPPLAPTPMAFQVTRRTKLPALPTWDEGSLFAILKKNVGKVSHCMPY